MLTAPPIAQVAMYRMPTMTGWAGIVLFPASEGGRLFRAGFPLSTLGGAAAVACRLGGKPSES